MAEVFQNLVKPINPWIQVQKMPGTRHMTKTITKYITIKFLLGSNKEKIFKAAR